VTLAPVFSAAKITADWQDWYQFAMGDRQLANGTAGKKQNKEFHPATGGSGVVWIPVLPEKNWTSF
jgi:hypothetical protein